MKYIPEMQNERNRYNNNKKRNITTCDCVTCCHRCDSKEIGLIDYCVTIAE